MSGAHRAAGEVRIAKVPAKPSRFGAATGGRRLFCDILSRLLGCILGRLIGGAKVGGGGKISSQLFMTAAPKTPHKPINATMIAIPDSFFMPASLYKARLLPIIRPAISKNNKQSLPGSASGFLGTDKHPRIIKPRIHERKSLGCVLRYFNPLSHNSASSALTARSASWMSAFKPRLRRNGAFEGR